MNTYIIKTPRLGLRNWNASDLDPATLMNADERVMEFFPNIWSGKETANFIKRMQDHYIDHGFCYFAVDLLETKCLIGFIGLSYQTFDSSFTPCIDIGWRLIHGAWGKGYATEGAHACLEYAFSTLKLKEVYAIAPKTNMKSQKVMQKLGMIPFTHFVHPKVDPTSELKNCVAYKILNVRL